MFFFTLVRGEENGIDCNQGDKPSDRGKRARGRGKRMRRKEILVMGRRRQAVHILSSLRAVYSERTVDLKSFHLLMPISEMFELYNFEEPYWLFSDELRKALCVNNLKFECSLWQHIY